jgi:hydroxymethylbilane synthase
MKSSTDLTSQNSSPSRLVLGTRKSLLAWAQSSWVAAEISRLNPELEVELRGIETQGDKILDKPLSEIEGKEFFTAELDHALLKNEVDLTVHSMKDLSLDRPAAFTLAATPKRELQHDLAIFHPSIIQRLTAGLPIRIGTSSPRRMALIPEFLTQALPQIHPDGPKIQIVPIRGNVNTRLGRIHEAEDSDRKLDGVILAFAGLERLTLDEVARPQIDALMKNTLKMMLPIRDCPSAPAQGALAIECRSDRADVLKAIQKLHDPETLAAVQAERELLKEWGGGCHQKLGASFFQGSIRIQGIKPDGTRVVGKSNSTMIPEDYLKVKTEELFNFKSFNPDEQERKQFDVCEAVFIGHFRAFENLPSKLKSKLIYASRKEARAEGLDADAANSKSIWVPGVQSWFKLARSGVWVEGCTDGLGIAAMETFAEKNLLGVRKKNWTFLTHKESRAMTPHFSFKISVVPTYSHEFKAVPDPILTATHLHWASGLAFSSVCRALWPEDREAFLKKHHACGPGRTLMVLRQHGVEPTLITEQE